ncbi:unnamed protein product [Parnassius mnemosyne]|uniref:PiggyBac transposable element-derived protein domain-containing protein n=1 Tax=Parnassius mnemosyne TaxID=213953 RepID=A0AAV1KGG3_9NEOP
MNSKPSTSKRSSSVKKTSFCKKRRNSSDEGEGIDMDLLEFSSDEEVYSQCDYEDGSSEEESDDSNLSIFDTRKQPEMIKHTLNTLQKSSSALTSTKSNNIASKPRPSHVSAEFSSASKTIDDIMPQSPKEMEDELMPQPPPANSRHIPSIVQDYNELPDLPDYLLRENMSTPSFSLLRSDVPTPDYCDGNLASEPHNSPSSSLPHLPIRNIAENLPSREGSSERGDLVSPSIFLSPIPNNAENLLSRQVAAAIRNDKNVPSLDCPTETWSTDRSSMKTIYFTQSQELLVPPPANPFEALRLLINDKLIDLIVQETNAHAVRVLSSPGVTDQSRITRWKDVTREELWTFFGLLLHTGTIRLNRLSDYWKTHWLFKLPCFSRYMPRNRFMLILRCLHFSSDSNEEDRLVPIRPIMNHFNETMKRIYSPGKQLSLDESMVLWRGRLIFRQYIKNKRHKYGIKLYVLAEPDGTVLNFQVYSGANDTTSGKGHTEKIVLKLLEERLDYGHSIYMDNYYNSYNLAVKLLERKTYCTGTLGKNRKNNPVDLGSVTLRKGENKSSFLNGVHIGKWRDKRNVLYISTEHDDEMVEVASKRGQVLLKPSAIVHYNSFMSGVDLQDQMLAYYPCQRKTLRWYKKLFVHILQMSLSNAFYLFNKYSNSDKMNLYDFRMAILENLLPQPVPTEQIKSKLKIQHHLTKIENFKLREKRDGNSTKITREIIRKECKGCRAKKKRVATL